MFLKTGGGMFLKNSAATGGMIQKNDSEVISGLLEYQAALTFFENPHVASRRHGAAAGC
jgi:hypothetical protein